MKHTRLIEGVPHGVLWDCRLTEATELNEIPHSPG